MLKVIKKSHFLLAILLGLLIGAMALIIYDHTYQQKNSNFINNRFQEAVGGFGLGASLTPTWQWVSFDPRVQSFDESKTWPVPGGYPFAPDRTASICAFPEIDKNHSQRKVK